MRIPKIRFRAVVVGTAMGLMAVVFVTLIEWWLGALGWEIIPGFGSAESLGGGAVAGLVVGVLLGGWATARSASERGPFHGAVAGLTIVGILVMPAATGGANVTYVQVLSAAALGITLGGLSGWWASR